MYAPDAATSFSAVNKKMIMMDRGHAQACFK
jgi:hypothetical protein